MRKIIFISLIVGCAIACATAQTKISGKATISGNAGIATSSSSSPLTQPLLSHTDITLVACIYLPAGSYLGSTTDGAGAYYDAGRDSIFLMGQINSGVNGVGMKAIGELKLPLLDTMCTGSGSTFTATFTGGQAMLSDPTEGNPDGVCAEILPNNCTAIDGFGIISDPSDSTKILWMNKARYYADTNLPHGAFRRPKNLSDTGHVEGPYAAALTGTQVDSHRRWTGALTPIPPEWQSLLNATTMSVTGFGSTDASGCQMPCIWGFSPSSFANDFPIQRYAYSNPDSTGAGIFQGVNRVGGAIFIPGTRSIIVSQKTTTGQTIYGVSSGEKYGYTFAGSGTGTAWNIDTPGNGSPFVGNVSTDATGTVVTLPNASWGGGFPGDWMICIEGQTTPTYYFPGTPPVCATCLTSAWYPGCSEVSSGINSGAANAQLTVAVHAFAPNLTGRTAHLGQAISFQPIIGRGGGGFQAWPLDNSWWIYDAKCLYNPTLCGFADYTKVVPYDVFLWDNCDDPTMGASTGWQPTTCLVFGLGESMFYVPKNAHAAWNSVAGGGPFLALRSAFGNTLYGIFKINNVP